ncbi:MAG: FAD binding domain-containing protein [Deltaproteobacteria bacterium]|nr:FAD binding domain-containing protein [Deltaproteobacteria bacterium]
MKPFKHKDAKSINQAVKLQSEGKTKLIAGGTDLLGILKDEILPEYPDTIINIKTIPKLDYIREDARGLKIGALTKLEDIAGSPLIREKYKILAEAAEAVATPHIRTMGTIGGNLCQDVRCWYYRYPDQIGGRIDCYLKGGEKCYAMTGENQYHSIFGGLRVTPTSCQSACPGHVNIPAYLSRIREGNLPGAASDILRDNPFPAITGRVCPHFCEQSCNRGNLDESLSIRDIERFIGDYILDNADEVIEKPGGNTRKKVAIIGSGPSGLSTAYYLRLSGHRVTVFDRMEEAGGLLRYVIPSYRLPKDIVRRTVKILEDIGIEFRLRVDVGKDITIDSLRKDYDAVFIGTGAWNPVSIGLDGEESTVSALEFLAAVQKGIKKAPGRKVLVIGGGNAAIDAAITSLRLGAEEATMAFRKTREDTPALKWEIEQAEEENVRIMPSWAPHRILKSNGKLAGMELIRCISARDKSGRFTRTYDENTKTTVEADVIVMAVGYEPDPGFALGVIDTSRGLIGANHETQATATAGIFAGGEASRGPATVIEAIADGRRAALAIDAYLNKTGSDKEDAIKPLLKFNPECCGKTEKLESIRIPVNQRTIDTEDTPGCSLDDIQAEADRCFNCGCVSVNASDTGVALEALNARVKIVGPRGTRTIPVAGFFGSFPNALEQGDIVTEIQVPSLHDGDRQTFVKFRLREAIDFALISVASVISIENGICHDARIVLGAVAPRPLRAIAAEKVLVGKALDDKQAAAAAEAALEDALPLEKNSYKIPIAGEMVRRAILNLGTSGK